MNTKILFIITIGIVIIVAVGLYVFTQPKNMAPNISPTTTESKKEIKPSETYIEYIDPSGFSFNYPDNLSIEKNEETDNNTYADLQLFSKDVSGSLSLRIADTKLKTLDEWAKAASASGTLAQRQLGSLKAFEIRTKDRLMLGAIDQGILFNVEVPLIEEDFWTKVYDKVLADFSFTTPETTTATTGSSEEIIFEGEEVVE